MNFQPPEYDDPRDDDQRMQDAERAGPWLCFHCDEAFADRDAARDHFGHSEYSSPACQINAAEYREMEERMRRYNDEDADIHRQMYGMQGAHATAVLRAEETGYARGLRDAALYPAELGLQVAQPNSVEFDGIRTGDSAGVSDARWQNVWMSLAAVPCSCSRKLRENGDHVTGCSLFDVTVALDELALGTRATEPAASEPKFTADHSLAAVLEAIHAAPKAEPAANTAEFDGIRTEPTMADALAAGDGTLHGAIDHWQERALRAEAALKVEPGEAERLTDEQIKAAVKSWFTAEDWDNFEARMRNAINAALATNPSTKDHHD